MQKHLYNNVCTNIEEAALQTNNICMYTYARVYNTYVLRFMHVYTTHMFLQLLRGYIHARVCNTYVLTFM